MDYKNVPVHLCGVTGQELWLAPGLESSQHCILPSSRERSLLDSGHQARGAVRARDEDIGSISAALGPSAEKTES